MTKVSRNYRISYDRLYEVWDYNPGTGLWRWRIETGVRCKMGIWQAGTIDDWGYLRVKIDRQTYVVSRLAWFYVTGTWPNNEIDHKDCNKTNNIWKNLREATNLQQSYNKRGYGKTGVKGVCYHKASRKYMAQITIVGDKVHLGVYNTIEEASSAYEIAAREVQGTFAFGGSK